MLPADVKVIIVDINQPTVTKLMDRGTWQALGIVTDVGAFMPMLAEQIRKKKSRICNMFVIFGKFIHEDLLIQI